MKQFKFRPLSEIEDTEKNQFFQYIFPKQSDRYAVLRVLRTSASQSEKDIVLEHWSGMIAWLFRKADDNSIQFSGSDFFKYAHYLRACFWLRSHGIEVPVATKIIEG
jgi:hypothetical protein